MLYQKFSIKKIKFSYIHQRESKNKRTKEIVEEIVPLWWHNGY